jgi:TBC1 domain family member 2A
MYLVPVVLFPQDIAATFPNHPWFQSADGKAAMKRVLSAYSVHNDKLGYCRSMNFIVGLLLAAMNR